MNLTFLTARVINIQKKVNEVEKIQITLRVPNIRNGKGLSFYQVEGHVYGQMANEFINTSVIGDFVLVKGHIHIISDSVERRRKRMLIKILYYQTILSNLYNKFE